MKQLYIFGNGLGRSFENDFYSLKRALEHSWGVNGPLDDTQRQLIHNCLSDDVVEKEISAPTDEGQLRDLQRAVDACDLLEKFQHRADAECCWLSDDGKRFPNAVRSYIHDAASQFHSPEMKLPSEFEKKLIEFVEKERPHIATLNYDDLLYEAFTETPIFKKHMLRDGFLYGSFDFDTQRKWLNKQKEGWFLHLHGSPLFVTKEGSEKKITRADLDSYKGADQIHLVLTDAKSKPSTIRSSAILKAYWEELERILAQPAQVTLFGYGGNDLHLNQLLSNTNDETSIRVVSRTPEDTGKAKENWRNRFRGKEITDKGFIFLDCILDHKFV